MKLVTTNIVFESFEDVPDRQYFIEQDCILENNFDPKFAIYFKDSSSCYTLHDSCSGPGIKEGITPDEGPFVLLNVEFVISVK